MTITRRDFLAAAAAVIGAPGFRRTAAMEMQRALTGESKVPVIWLQGAGCNGDSVSFLNSIFYGSAEEFLLNTLDVKYHPTVMAAAGELAVSAAEAAQTLGGYVLIVEGSIPTGSDGKFCKIWNGMTMQNALMTYAPNASHILAVGTCAAYGGFSAGSPNPTASLGVSGVLGNLDKIINIPGCPAHPDWVVGTIAYLLTQQSAPTLDNYRRPTMYYGTKIHNQCAEHRKRYGTTYKATQLSQDGCLAPLGCKGQWTYADCPMRMSNSGEKDQFGVNWCIGSRSPCIGCVQPNFPDGMTPFLK